jgi:hypothetical protein
VSPQWFLSFRFPHQHPVHIPPLHHTRYMPRPSNSSRFYHSHYCGWGVQVMKHYDMKGSQFPSYLVRLRPKYSPQHPIFKHTQPTFLPSYQRPSFKPIQTTRKFIVLSKRLFKFFYLDQVIQFTSIFQIYPQIFCSHFSSLPCVQHVLPFSPHFNWPY